jgi:sugar phosphate isomerase/epimerase
VDKIHVHIPYSKVGHYLALIKQERLNLEIYFPSSSLDTLKTEEIERLRDSLDYHPSLSIHSPFMDLSPGAVDPKIKAVTVERYTQVFDIAEILRPNVIVFHSGYEKWKYAHRVDLWLEESLSTWKPLISRAALLGTRIAIENIFEDEPSNLYLLMKEIESLCFGICFDTGHYNIFSKVSLEEWLGLLSPYIIELHLHDNDKSFDSHLAIGEGTFDFKTLLSRLKERDCVYTIEAHTPEEVLKSIGRLKDMAA